jgi:transposase-like protein
MNCPRCETPMSKGAPHSEGDAFQWECGNCGKCIGEPRGTDRLEPYRYGAMDTVWMRRKQ